MELIAPILYSQSSLTWSVEWWGSTRHVGWRVEFGVNSDTTEDTNWFSGMVELVTVDMDFSTTISWTSQRSGLSNTWWVEEDELDTLRHILVIQRQLHHN